MSCRTDFPYIQQTVRYSNGTPHNIEYVPLRMVPWRNHLVHVSCACTTIHNSGVPSLPYEYKTFPDKYEIPIEYQSYKEDKKQLLEQLRPSTITTNSLQDHPQISQDDTDEVHRSTCLELLMDKYQFHDDPVEMDTDEYIGLVMLELLMDNYQLYDDPVELDTEEHIGLICLELLMEKYQFYNDPVESDTTLVEDVPTLIVDSNSMDETVQVIPKETNQDPRSTPVCQHPIPYSLMGSADKQDLELSLEAEPPPSQDTSIPHVDSYDYLVGINPSTRHYNKEYY